MLDRREGKRKAAHFFEDLLGLNRTQEGLAGHLLEAQLLAGVLDGYLLERLMGLVDFLAIALTRRCRPLANALGQPGHRFRH